MLLVRITYQSRLQLREDKVERKTVGSTDWIVTVYIRNYPRFMMRKFLSFKKLFPPFTICFRKFATQTRSFSAERSIKAHRARIKVLHFVCLLVNLAKLQMMIKFSQLEQKAL